MGRHADTLPVNTRNEQLSKAAVFFERNACAYDLALAQQLYPVTEK